MRGLRAGGIGLILSAIFLFFLPSGAFSEEKKGYFELGIGEGISLRGAEASHTVLVPAFNRGAKDFLRLRLEGNLEYVSDEGRGAFFIGGAPSLRFLVSEKAPRPFLEIGVGLNYASSTVVGDRELGGHFLFSLMGSIGCEFEVDGRPVTLSYRARHLSNGHLYSKNMGIDSQYIILSMGLKK
jgi:hypothetical protein